MKILITGATGFIGSHLAKVLSKKQKVYALCRRQAYNSFLEKNKIPIIKGNLLDKASLLKATKNIDVIFHCAGGGRYTDSYEHLYKLNVAATKNILEAAAKNNIKKFVYLSSVAVSGNCKMSIPITESDTFPSFGNYGKTKLLAEKECLKYKNIIIIRPSTVYGEILIKRKPEEIAGAASTLRIAERLKQRKIVFIGNGKNYLHPLYITNLIHALELTLSIPPRKQIFTVADEKPIRYEQYVKLIAEELKIPLPGLKVPFIIAVIVMSIQNIIKRIKKQPIFVDIAALRRATLNYKYDLSKAKKELKYKPIISTKKAIKKTMSFYLKKGMI